MAYPANAVPLISPGIAGISWPRRPRAAWLLKACALALAMGLLMPAVAVG